MGPLFPEETIKHNKKPKLQLERGTQAAQLARGQAGVSPAGSSAILLYKSIHISATSGCAKVACDLPVAPGCGPLSRRSESGKQAARSSAEAGHDSWELGAEQKIHRRSNTDK
jgi:hypothetical protein